MIYNKKEKLAQRQSGMEIWIQGIDPILLLNRGCEWDLSYDMYD
jgi:hypothetical protein